MQWIILVMVCCGMAVKRLGMLGVKVRKMKTLTVKMVIVTLVGKGRWNLTCRVSCIKCVRLIIKYFFLADILLLGVVIDLDKYIFPWQTCFLVGHPRLESSYIRVNTVIKWALYKIRDVSDQHQNYMCLTDKGTISALFDKNLVNLLAPRMYIDGDNLWAHISLTLTPTRDPPLFLTRMHASCKECLNTVCYILELWQYYLL